MNATSNYSCIGSTYDMDSESKTYRTILRAVETVRRGLLDDDDLVACLGSLEDMIQLGFAESDNPDAVDELRESEEAVVESFTRADFCRKVREALGEYAASDSNPCGGCGYYDADESNPFRVCFSDAAGCESYSNMSSAISAARAWAECQSADEGR